MDCDSERVCACPAGGDVDSESDARESAALDVAVAVAASLFTQLAHCSRKCEVNLNDK